MTLETVLRQFLFTPNFIQTGNEKPRKAYWVGDKESAKQNQDQGGKKNDFPPKKRDSRGYRDLASVTLGDVSDAHKFYENQLVPGPYPSWVGTNYFCMVNLVRQRETRPPAVFGRVKTCYPSDGYIQNIQEMELFIPHKENAPDVVLLHSEDIRLTPNKPLQSYCVRVNFLASQEDIADFEGQENLFLEKGFILEFNTSYIELLDINEHNQTSLPWMYVIGSRWFESIPVSVQPEIREKLTKLIHWNKLIFNYHPDRLPKEIKTLNRELGLKAGYSDIFLIEPEDPQQTVHIVARTFDKIFSQPMGK